MNNLPPGGFYALLREHPFGFTNRRTDVRPMPSRRAMADLLSYLRRGKVLASGNSFSLTYGRIPVWPTGMERIASARSICIACG